MRVNLQLMVSTLTLGVLLHGMPVVAAEGVTPPGAAPELLATYERLLPLQGGSNFRDMGGYTTVDGKSVKRGVLFRSGAMVSLTEADMDYLNRFDFQTVVDLRSSDELELYPNRWAQSIDVEYVNEDYSMLTFMGDMMQQLQSGADGMEVIQDQMGMMYQGFPDMLKPQLTELFDSLLQAQTPLVVNCSAGQDRTGVATALVLSALGVPRETILDDYLLSTQYRVPANERGNVDLEEAAKTNAFAQVMLSYNSEEGADEPNPLYGDDGVPFLTFTLEAIEAEHGTVLDFLETELGIDDAEIEQLRALYLQ
ncbi:MAG: hypothetical protein RLZZ385_1950 [Pseudomonadota bacterium]